MVVSLTVTSVITVFKMANFANLVGDTLILLPLLLLLLVLLSLLLELELLLLLTLLFVTFGLGVLAEVDGSSLLGKAIGVAIIKLFIFDVVAAG